MSGTGKRKDRAADKDADTPSSEKKRRRSSGEKVKSGAIALRGKLASVIWLIAVVCALFLAIGALLVALNANDKNSIVVFIQNGADFLDGPFSRDNGVFTFDGKAQHANDVKNALVNWGIAAVVYLVIGKVLDRIVRP